MIDPSRRLGPGARLSPAPSCLEFPANALVILVGASASGKSSWARERFLETEIVSSDRCRALVSDDETNQSVNREAFAVFYEIIRRRLSLGRFTVADSTSLSGFARERLCGIARDRGAPAYAVVIYTPLEVLLRNNQLRDRQVPEPVLQRHADQLRWLLENRVLEQEGYQAIHCIPFRELPRTRVHITPPRPGRAVLTGPETGSGVAREG